MHLPIGLTALRAVFLVAALVAAVPSAFSQAEVSATPSQFSAGARIKVYSEGLATSTNYRLRLEQQRPGVQTWDLADFNTGTRRQVAASVTVPDVAAGRYDLVLYRVALGLTAVAGTEVTVVPSLGIVPTPTSARPGKSVRLTVSNLAAGSLRVLYAGSTVLGPVAVGEGTWQGRFIVPRDRPASLPANVPIVVENVVGRTVVRRGSIDFAALAPSNLPRLGLTVAQQPTTTLDPGAPFVLSGTLRTDDGVAPRGTQSMYWRDPSGRVMPLDSDVEVAQDGSFTMSARAPDPFRDGYLAVGDRAGIVSVVSRGTSIHTDATEDGIAAVGDQPEVVIDGRDSGSVTFTVVVLGDQPGSNDPPLENVFVEVQQEYRNAFGFALPGGGTGSASDEHAFMSTTANQIRDLRTLSFPPVTPAGYGCDVTVFRRRTPANGSVVFTFNPATIAQTNLIETVQNCADGNCGDQPAGAPPKGGPNFGRAGFAMWVYAAHLGYRTQPLSLTYDGDTGQIIDETSGQPLANNRLEVRLQPSQTTDYDLRNLRIDGLGGPGQPEPYRCPGSSAGICFYTPYAFGNMYTFPDTNLWPDNRFEERNVGTAVRLQVDPLATGTLTSGWLRVPGYGDRQFVASGGTPACILDQTTPVEYVATLPDLTRAPVSPVVRNDDNLTVSGGIPATIELKFGSNPTRSFPIRIGTQRPPTGIDVTNASIASLTINGRTGRIYGDYRVRDASIPVDSPVEGMGRLDSASENESSFDFLRTPDAVAAERIAAVSNNDVAGEAGGPRASNGVFFGFTSPEYTTPQPVVLFDTGSIPLFRYSWGIPPLASATLGADFWMAAELAYYGQLRTQGMNATIDPTVEGGVDLFFDLDVLFGLVSASIAAETELGVTMRSVIGQGGLAHRGIQQQSGECFRFDLDAVWEACFVLCEGGRESIIRVREPSGCAVSEAAKERGAKAFDLARPSSTATAMANDGRGNTITVGIDDRGALVATHLTGTSVVATRTIAALPVAVQHIDVVFHGANRALAAWSENRLSAAQVADIVRAQGGRAFDDLVRTQRLRFSVFDGRAWSAPADLTSVGNDGKPQLAACLPEPRSISFDCPSGGEVTAVWERDANANLDAPDIEVWSATWTPSGGWRSVARVSNTGASSDMLPSVAYRNGVPVVAWAHNPSGHFTNLGGRRVAYRFLDGSSPTVVATSFGSGVGWVSVAVSPADHVVIAFTRAQDSQGFVGNRQALAAARATSCSAGTCAFLVTEPRDANGRQYRVERPSVSFDDDGSPVIGFRGLAFGPAPGGGGALASDPPGMLLGTGELAMVRVHSFAQSTYTARLANLSANALQHFKPEFAFDPTVGGVLAVSQEAALPAGQSTPLEMAKKISPEGFVAASVGKALGTGAVLRTLDGGPDFALRDVALSRSVVAAGQSLQLTLSLVNEGQAYDPSVHGPLRVAAAWNAPPGAGVAAGTFDLATTLAANASRAVSIALTVPAGMRNDERQTLFVEVVAEDLANATTGPADQWRLVLNEMPVPQAVQVDTRRDSPLVDISWSSPADARVAGWRVWKRDAEGAWRHLGSTRQPGYLDITGVPGAEVQYRVASYSINGMESDPSEAAWGFIEQTLADALFTDGFEPAAGPLR